MPLFYQATPWLIPQLDQNLAEVFHRIGFFYHVEKNSLLHATNLKGNGETLTFLQDGLLGQSYDMDDPNRPHTISLVLPGRMINYAAYLGIDNSQENVLILRDSDVWTCQLSDMKTELDKLDLHQAFLDYCIKCVASDYSAFTCMFSCTTEVRLAHLFRSLINSLQCQYTDKNVFIPLKLTYIELSYVMHSSKKTIERIFAKWHKENVISNDLNGFTVDIEFLRALTSKKTFH